MDFETAMEMQRICTGERRELSRGRIAGEVLDIGQLTKGFNQERRDKCTAFYEKLTSDETKKVYDADALVEETERIKAQFDEFLKGTAGDDMCGELFEKISEFFMTPPFEGLDGVEYGVNEVCVFSVLEYFVWKVTGKHDHEQCRRDYRDSIAERTYEEVGDHWIGVFDDLQRRYGLIGGELSDEKALAEKLAGCCIVAIAAIRDQDSFALDMAQAGAEEKGREIAAAYLEGSYEEGESSFTDNVMRLLEFVKANL